MWRILWLDLYICDSAALRLPEWKRASLEAPPPLDETLPSLPWPSLQIPACVDEAGEEQIKSCPMTHPVLIKFTERWTKTDSLEMKRYTKQGAAQYVRWAWRNEISAVFPAQFYLCCSRWWVGGVHTYALWKGSYYAKSTFAFFKHNLQFSRLKRHQGCSVCSFPFLLGSQRLPLWAHQICSGLW